MKNDVRLALLGDKAAQERLTELGKPLPCPLCRGNASLRYTGSNSGPFGYTCNVYKRSKPGLIKCNKCGLATAKRTKICRALRNWNTRPEIMGPDELEKLEELK